MKLPNRSDFIAICLISLLQPNVASADLGSALRHAARAGAGVTQDIPPNAFDRVLSRTEVTLASGARRIDPVIARAKLGAISPDLLRQIDELPPMEAKFALEIFEGGRALRTGNPDELARARLISAGGTDLLIAAQRHGDQVAKPAYMLQIAEESGQLPAGSVANFSRISVSRGAPFINGWNRHIVPNWKPLVASGLVLSCLAASESCIDEAGNLVEHAAGTVSQLAVTIGAKTVTGTASGAGEAVVRALKGSNAPWFIAGLAGLGLALWLMRRILRSVTSLPARLAAPVRARKSDTPAPNSNEKLEDSAGPHKRRGALRDRDI